MPDDCELARIARLDSHLFVELGDASRIDWQQDIVPTLQRRKLTHAPSALPRLLALVQEAQAVALRGGSRSGALGAGGGGGGGGSNASASAAASAR